MRVTGEGRWRTTAYGLISLLAIGAGGTASAQQTTLDKQEQLRRAQQLEQKEILCGGFPGTTVAELAEHGYQPVNGIRFSLDRPSMPVLDLTNPDVAKAWGYVGGEATDATRAMGQLATQQGFNAIKFYPERLFRDGMTQ